MSTELTSAPERFGIVIGAMKSGTTTLFDVLGQHPEVSACREKEPDFFADSVRFARGPSSYFELWDWSPDTHQVAIEASTAYSKHPWVPGVPERIASTLDRESVRFIYMVRHPLRRIGSQVRHGLYEGWGQSLDDGITDDVLDFSRYSIQLDRYLACFGRNQFLVIALEEYQRAPDRVLRRVCEFLGIASDFEFTEPGRVVNSGAFFEVPGHVRAVAHSGVVRRLIQVLPVSMKAWLRSTVSKLGRAKLGGGEECSPLGRWSLTPRESREIVSALRPDLIRLRDEWGVDVEGLWGISMPDQGSAGAHGRDPTS